MEQKFCQSCGMPLTDHPELFGKEADGSLSEDYCIYCYNEGKFTFEGSMEEMIGICVPHFGAAHKEISETDARNMMQKYFPNLKRWRKSPSREELEQKAESLLDQCPTIVLNSITENGYPRGCVLVKVSNEGFKKIRVATGSSSRKTGHFKMNPKAGVCFSNEKDGVTLLGTVRILDDPEERAQYWQNWMIDHFPLGKNDPEFCVLEFTTEEATIWIDSIFETWRW